MPGGAAAAGTQGHPPNRLHLPLSDHDHEVNMILGALTLELGTVRSIAGAWADRRASSSRSRRWRWQTPLAFKS